MIAPDSLIKRLFSLSSKEQFDDLCLDIFHFQSESCLPYKQYISYLELNPSEIHSVEQIPFLPISLFKSHKIYSSNKEPDTIFTSSGTTGSINSQHYVADISLYSESYNKGFRFFYGEPSEYTILALLPSYLERKGSSLIDMVEGLIKETKSVESGFFLYNHEQLYSSLLKIRDSGRKCLLIGVSFALLDFIEKYSLSFPDLIVMETGGMKGKRRELPRSELHEILSKGFGVAHIHSEYGMTELLSQAYSIGGGIFNTPPWMHILIRDTQNPFRILSNETTGGINVIDLANIFSCSFIETQDLGVVHQGGFEIIGRFDESDIRGCNLMVL